MSEYASMVLDRRNLLRLGLYGAGATVLAGCGGVKKGKALYDKQSRIVVTVWSPQEDQSNENGRWLQTECEAFEAAHPEWKLSFRYGVCPESDVKANVVTDPAAAADVFLISNDQIPDLNKAVGIAELGGTRVDAIKASNSQTAVDTVTYEGGVYGVPFTANTWFMYYDRSVFSEDDITSLDTMLAKDKVAFPLDNGWYNTSFYIANGCTLFGEDGNDASDGFDFGGDKAVEVTNYLVDLVSNPNFFNGNADTNSGVKAFFSGTWDFQQALDAFGDNLGCAPPPCVSINGEPRQLMAFAGTKAVGANPSTVLYRTFPEIAVELVMHLGGADAQRRHYELRGIIPSDTSVDVSDMLSDAQAQTMERASIVQPLQSEMTSFWTRMESMGKELVAGAITHENAAKKTESLNTSLNTPTVGNTERQGDEQ